LHKHERNVICNDSPFRLEGFAYQSRDGISGAQRGTLNGVKLRGRPVSRGRVERENDINKRGYGGADGRK
jgi:hypothetical protein